MTLKESLLLAFIVAAFLLTGTMAFEDMTNKQPIRMVVK